MEVCDQVLARDNGVMICWVPAHCGILGSKKADEFTKAAAGRRAPCREGDVPGELWWEASLSHITRSATEVRFSATAEWIADRIGIPRYRPPQGRGLHRQYLRSTRKELDRRYYQFLSGHAAIGSYLHDKLHKSDLDRYWWCDTGKH